MHWTVNTKNVIIEVCHEKQTTVIQIKKAAVAGYPALGHRVEKKTIKVTLNKKISGNLATVKASDFHSLELQFQKYSSVPSCLTGNQSLCGIKSLESL